MGALVSIPRAYKRIKRIPTLPLPEVYRTMMESSRVTVLVGVVYLIGGFYRVFRDDLPVGILMIISAIFSGFAIASHLYNKFFRTVDSMYIAAVANTFSGLLMIATIVTEFVLGFQDPALMILIILVSLGMLLNVGLVLYTTIIVVKRLKAGESPRTEANENAISGTVSVLQDPLTKDGS